jgi:iron(III) transport system permease protein
VSAVLAGLTVVLIATPLFKIAAFIFSPGRGAVPVLSIFQDMVSRRILEAAASTLGIVAVSGLIALGIGLMFAWANERSDARMSWLTDVLPLGSLFVPVLASAFGWLFLASPKAGYLNILLGGILAAFGRSTSNSGPLNILTWYGLVTVYTFYLVPFAYLIASSALRGLDPQLEEAARISGASQFRTLRTVTFPMIMPTAIGSAALLLLVQGAALFSVPIVIATRANIPVLSVEIVNSVIAAYPPQYSVAIASSCLMLLIVGTGWLLQRRLAAAGHFAQIGGRRGGGSIVHLGRWRLPVRICMLAYLFVGSILPVAALVLVSLQGFWSRTIRWHLLTFEAYRLAVVSSGYVHQAIIDSLFLAIAGASIVTLVAAVISTFITRRPRGLKRGLDGFVKLPGTIPHVILAVGVVLAFAGPPFSLGGTVLILLLAYVMLYFAQASFNVGPVYDQIGNELTEASSVAGAGPFGTFWRVQLPLMAAGMANAWAIVFIFMVGDVSASVLLASSRSPVIGFAILDLWTTGTYPTLAALATILTCISAVTVSAVLIAARRRQRSYVRPH